MVQEQAWGTRLKSLLGWVQEPRALAGLKSGTLQFNNPTYPEQLNLTARGREYQVRIQAVGVGTGDFSVYSRALRMAQEAGISQRIAGEHLLSGHSNKYGSKIQELSGTATVREVDLDQQIRAIFSPRAAIIYQSGGDGMLDAFVVYPEKEPDQLAA